MAASIIDVKIKRKCIDMLNMGKTYKEIYTEYYGALFPETSMETFRKSLHRWKKKTWADNSTLYAGTYPNFVPHDATVQVDKNGEIVQAWIKQHVSDFQMEKLLATICENTQPVDIEPCECDNSHDMLEIPLFDMHFPFSNYTEQAKNILAIITKQHWKEINIIIGQDLFHNDDFRGRTSSGRPIEKIDLGEAWNLAKTFWFNIIKMSFKYSDKVNLYYSKGNHDESMSWAFVQMLNIAFPKLNIDDSLKPRKCISWEGCFIGITHGSNIKNSPNDMRGQFTIEFPIEFANAKVREVHCGHLHHEKEGDLYGVMVRRLSSGVPTDNWSEEEGFVGANKRFMLFEWSPNKLKAIDYI